MVSILLVIVTAAVIGAVAAVAGIAFIEGASSVNQWLEVGEESGLFLTVLPPVLAGGVCAWLARYLPKQWFLGLADMVLLAQRDVRTRRRHDVLSVLAAWIALAGGASVGQYGPIAHVGGMLGTFSHRLPAAVAVACGVAAAIAAAFNAPITGLIFAHEVVLRHYSLRAFTPVAVSVVVAYSITTDLFPRPTFLQVESMPTMHPLAIPFFIVQGAIFGVLAMGFVRFIFRINDGTARLPLYWRLPAAGLVVGLLALLTPSIGGGGKPLLEATLTGFPIETAALLLSTKTIATLVCLGAGFAGGIVSPTLTIGALAGLLFFQLMSPVMGWLPVPVPMSAMVLCGMMALAAPVIGAPMTGILFVMELSGSYPNSIAAVVAIAVSMQTAARLGHRSYYDNQIIRRGFDTQQRRDEWRLKTTLITSLARPVEFSLPAQTTVQMAVDSAVNKALNVVYIIDDERYLGCLPLSILMQQVAVGNDQRCVGEIVVPDALTLSVEDTVEVAMGKIKMTGDSTLPVLSGQHLLGVISEGDLLRLQQRLLREYRDEETAV